MLAEDGTLIVTAYSSTSSLAAGTTWKFETPIPFENAARFPITKLSCSRNETTHPRMCSLVPVEVPRPSA